MKSLVRKVAAGVLAAATMLGVAGLGATTASAEDATGKLTVTSSDAAFNGKTVKAYQMFSASPDAEGQNATYTLASPWDNFFKTNANEFGITDVTDANVSENGLRLRIRSEAGRTRTRNWPSSPPRLPTGPRILATMSLR